MDLKEQLNGIQHIGIPTNDIEATIDEAMVKQANLKSATLRPVSRDTFYNNIEDSDFIKKLKVGLCFKERVKQIMPGFVISWLKRRF